MVITDDVLMAIRRLRDSGMGVPQIARVSGVNHWTIIKIAARRQTRALASTVEKLMAVKPTRARGALVSSWRSRRVVQALLAEGYTKADIMAAWKARTGTQKTKLLYFRERVRVKSEHGLRSIHRRLTT